MLGEECYPSFFNKANPRRAINHPYRNTAKSVSICRWIYLNASRKVSLNSAKKLRECKKALMTGLTEDLHSYHANVIISIGLY